MVEAATCPGSRERFSGSGDATKRRSGQLCNQTRSKGELSKLNPRRREISKEVWEVFTRPCCPYPQVSPALATLEEQISE